MSFDSYEVFETTQANNVNSYYYDYQNLDVEDISQIKYDKYTSYESLHYVSGSKGNQRAHYYNLNLLGGLSYENSFGKHNVSARAFARAYRNQNNVLEANNPQYNSSKRYLSYNGQVNYNYDSRYLLSANISRMGNDNYREDSRWGTFYGGSLGWVASEEPWLKNNKHIDLLKLRASYGHSGQSETGAGRYPYQNTYGSSTGYGFGYNAGAYVNGFAETMAGNANNIWEISDMLNIGLDFDFWNKKLYGQIDIFKEWRSNILVERSSVPSILGISVAKDSYGKAETKGFEVTLGHRNHIGDFNFYIEGMLTYNTNKITEMDETEPNVPWQRKTGNRILDYTSVAGLYEASFNQTIGGWNRYKFTQWASDPNLIATSHQDAIDHPEKYPYHSSSNGNQLLGTAVFKDLNGDRLIDSNDMVPDTYTIIPELIPTLNFGFEWKGFDARAVLTAYMNRDVFLSPAVSWSGWGNQGTHEVVKSWGYYTDDPQDPRNVNATYPRPVYSGYNAIDSDRDSGTYQNDIWIVNGNFLSLRNVEVGYSLPRKLIAKANLTKCRVYFSGYNLCTWSSIPDGLDPEKPMSYCWWYPKTRTFTFGINVGF